ncbi:MAG: radical SAM family heme chaperone HemW, partial [Calditrichia bacterium]
MRHPCGLYIHIPFCVQKCGYCEFYSITRTEQIESFVQALLIEIELRAELFNRQVFHTIFLGGGTPSLLSENQMERIWSSLKNNFKFIARPETTIEANPGTLSPSKLEFLKDSGFNRLSLGVQSFNANELKFLGRIHSATEALEIYENARSAGFQNINIDLMTAFPGITHRSFRGSLKTALQLQPEHISCYTLIFEPGTPFHRRMKRGELIPLSADAEAEYYEIARQTLESSGYYQYEISNFAKGADYICKHNTIYWKQYPYLGLGSSAHSFHKNIRSANIRSVNRYISLLKQGKLPQVMTEQLSQEQMMFEYIFLNLRLRDGLDLTDFRKRFKQDFLKKYHSELKLL